MENNQVQELFQNNKILSVDFETFGGVVQFQFDNGVKLNAFVKEVWDENKKGEKEYKSVIKFKTDNELRQEKEELDASTFEVGIEDYAQTFVKTMHDKYDAE